MALDARQKDLGATTHGERDERRSIDFFGDRDIQRQPDPGFEPMRLRDELGDALRGVAALERESPARAARKVLRKVRRSVTKALRQE